MIQLKAICNHNYPINISNNHSRHWNVKLQFYLLHCLIVFCLGYFCTTLMDYIKSNVTAGFCLYYFVNLCIFLFLQNVVMQLWTWCLSFIGLHWYCEYTQKVSPNCIYYSCSNNMNIHMNNYSCVANEIEFCCSCYLDVLLLKLSFMVFYRSLNVIVRDGNVLDAEWTRSQPFHSSATKWSGLEWRMRGVILRPDTEFPAFSPSVQSKESTGNATFIWSQIGIFFICTYKCVPLYKCASIFSQLHTFDTLM